MATFPTAQIRNVVLTGHLGSGKTTIVERLLFDTHAIGKMGSVGDGSTVSDFEAEEKHHKHSLYSSLVHFVHNRTLVNVIDTPGSPDFIGQAVSVLAPAEMVVVVIDAARGIEVTTRRVMKVAGELGMPRLVLVNKIDHEEKDLPGLLEEIREAFGKECLAINLPVRSGTDVIDVFDHATPQAGAGGGGIEADFSSVAAAHQAIIEQVVEMDEELTGEYFEKGDHLDPIKMRGAFESAMRAGHLVPVAFCSARTGAGIGDLLHIITDLCPTPLHETPPALMQADADGKKTIYDPEVDPSKPAVAHVFKIVNDPFKGKLAVFRVIQGTVKAKSELFHNEDKKPVRIGHLFKIRGAEHTEVDHLTTGDIGCVAKVDELKYNSVLHADASLHLHAPEVPLPRPLYGVAVELKNHADETKFTNAMHKLMEEDPCFAMERVAATGQTVLRGQGELHLRMMLERLKTRYNIELTTQPTKIAYKETITAKAEGHHRHKKQTGGAGQFGEVFLRVEPLPADHETGFEFVNATVGGSIPRQFMPAVEKGCRQVLTMGAIAGYPLTGVRVEVYDGKYHDVDSKEVAFVAAGKKAFMDAVAKARPALMEPWVLLEVTAPAAKMGDLTADISGKRGRVQSSDIDGSDQCVIRAHVPLSELANYTSQLKSMTGGQGSYTLEYSHDERAPSEVQAKVVAAFKPKDEDD
ncbi:MAG: elongation factor G [Phycisphaerales bacterium]